MKPINKWQIALQDYRAQLNGLQGSLSEDSYQFFDEADLHDGELLDLQIVDGSRPGPISEPSRPWATMFSYPVKASLSVLDGQGQVVWRVSYRAMRRVAIDFPTEDLLFHQEGAGFGDWGYHELTDAGNGFLRHEVLFSSGAMLLFEFKEVAVNCVPRSSVPTPS